MQRELVIAGHRLELRHLPAREPGAPTLVFLHEGLGSLGLWRDFPDRLCARTGCAGVVYSRWGNGFSEVIDEPRSVTYMHDEALTSLPELLAACAITDAILVGHSDGASITLLYAAAGFPLRGAVVLAPHVFVEEISVRSIAAIRTEYETTRLRERMARHHAQPDRTFFSWNDIWLAPAFRSWNIESGLERIDVPLLALQGLDDEYGTTAQLDAIAQRVRGPFDCAYLPGCRHSPQRDRPNETLARASAFIATLL